MSELKKQHINILKLSIIVICASLYAYGGIEEKWLRRFLAPAICGVFCAILSRDWKVLMKTPLLILSSVQGYGADETWLKILKRLKVGLSFGVAVSLYETIFNKKWIYMVVSVIVLVASFIILGVFNPIHARDEETLLGLIIYGFAIMPIQKKEK